MPYSLTPCDHERYTNVTGHAGRGSRNVAFCLASAFGAPDSEGDPPQCRWDDVNDISEEMGWAGAAVYNPRWEDGCLGLKGSGDWMDYCRCLADSNARWFNVFRENLLKYCRDKILVVVRRKDGSIGWSQRCEIRWILDHSSKELSCPIVPWTFDQLWEFRSLICRARHGGVLKGHVERVFSAASQQVVPFIAKQFAAPSSPEFERYLRYLESEQVTCWRTEP